MIRTIRTIYALHTSKSNYDLDNYFKKAQMCQKMYNISGEFYVNRVPDDMDGIGYNFGPGTVHWKKKSDL